MKQDILVNRAVLQSLAGVTVLEVKVPHNQQWNEGLWDAASAGSRRRREKLNKVNHRRDLQTRDDRYVQNELRLPSTNINIWRELWDFTPSMIFHWVWYTSQTQISVFVTLNMWHIFQMSWFSGKYFCKVLITHRIVTNFLMRYRFGLDGFGSHLSVWLHEGSADVTGPVNIWIIKVRTINRNVWRSLKDKHTIGLTLKHT